MAQKKRSVKFGFIFWVSFIALVALLFFINKNNIQTVLKNFRGNQFKTEQGEDLRVRIQDEIERINEEVPPQTEIIQDAAATSSGSAASNSNGNSNADTEKKTSTVENAKKPAQAEKEKAETKTEQEKKKDTSSKKTEADKKAAKSDNAKDNSPKLSLKTRMARIYFVAVDADGGISRVIIERDLPVSDSPMSDALKSLFSGTTESESKKYRTLIPPETKLLSAVVRDGIAYINVSESFEFNRYGIEGYLAELAQVVYTATEFSTVKAVQFLIEGQQKNYLGSDGVWIGSPLSRESFK